MFVLRRGLCSAAFSSGPLIRQSHRLQSAIRGRLFLASSLFLPVEQSDLQMPGQAFAPRHPTHISSSLPLNPSIILWISVIGTPLQCGWQVGGWNMLSLVQRSGVEPDCDAGRTIG